MSICPDEKKRSAPGVVLRLQLAPRILRHASQNRIDVAADLGLIIQGCKIWHPLSRRLEASRFHGRCALPRADVLLQRGEQTRWIVAAFASSICDKYAANTRMTAAVGTL